MDIRQSDLKKFTQKRVTTQNLICSWRARSPAHFADWLWVKNYVQEYGMDMCFLQWSLNKGFRTAMEQGEGLANLQNPAQIINIAQHNQFYYNSADATTSKPRREPIMTMNCSRKGFERTLSRAVWEYYVEGKARELDRDFSYYDFRELDHNSFRKIIMRLKNKRGKIITYPERTNPQRYILSERLMPENTRVQQMFTEVGGLASAVEVGYAVMRKVKLGLLDVGSVMEPVR